MMVEKAELAAERDEAIGTAGYLRPPDSAAPGGHAPLRCFRIFRHLRQPIVVKTTQAAGPH